MITAVLFSLATTGAYIVNVGIETLLMRGPPSVVMVSSLFGTGLLLGTFSYKFITTCAIDNLPIRQSNNRENILFIQFILKYAHSFKAFSIFRSGISQIMATKKNSAPEI